MASVSVIIPVRNGGPMLDEQLQALAGQTIADEIQLIISDNGSTDDTAIRVLKWSDSFADLLVVDASRRAGVSVARNEGSLAASTPKILYCDADDIVVPEWAEAMSRGLDTFALVGGRMRLDEVNSPHLLGWPGEATAEGLPVAMRFLPYAVGANMGVRRDLFDRLGGFDEDYIGGGEETDFAWRGQLLGAQIRFVPEAEVHYRLRATLEGAWKQFFGYGRAYAQLYRRFRSHTQTKLHPRYEAKQILRLLRRWAEFRNPDTQFGWVRAIAWQAGRAFGAVRYRVLPPS